MSFLPLHQLPEQTAARILRIPPSCLLGRRFADLGMTAGSRIRCLRRRGGLGAYEIRGAVIALRDRQTREILVQPEADAVE